MSKAAAKSKRTTTTAEIDLEQYEAAVIAKQQFLTIAFNMGWQLAVAVLLPLLLGIWLDKKFDSSPSYTLATFFIAVFFGSMVVWRTVQDLNKDMANGKKQKRGKK